MRVFGRRLPQRGRGSDISRLARFESPEHITLGAACRIAAHVLCSAPGDSAILLGDAVEVREYSFLQTQGAGYIRIGRNSTINPFCVLYGYGGLSIGEDAMLATGVVVVASQHQHDRRDVPMRLQGISAQGIEIGDDVWLGAGVRVLDGVQIGSHTIVGAGAVVAESLPESVIAVGVPARVVRSR